MLFNAIEIKNKYLEGVAPMRKGVISAAIILLSAAVFAQERPVVESISPRSGPLQGGTTVTIRGKNLAPFIPAARVMKPACTPCPAAPPVVLFGGKSASVQSYTNEELVVKTPPNSGGVYDVVVSNAYTFFGGPIDAQALVLPRMFQYGTNSYDKILVPVVAYRVAGAFGSIWSTELVGRNDNERSIVVGQYFSDLVETLTPPLWRGADAKSTFRPVLVPNGAAFLYHEHIDGSPGTKPLAFSLRVRDLSRQADSWGTEVPLVRDEDAFVARPMDMLNIPFEPESRITLRIYDFDGQIGGSVPVFIRNNESDAVLGSTIVSFAEGVLQNTPPAPGLVVLDVKPLVTNASGVERIRIQVGDPNLQKRLWALVSVTDLDTQQVTIVTPVK
ncbi:MAG: hypothetical protein DMF56_23305 [Acidobacteria bacterium]|nr:MAG: hypothetical protein DMF56_23305 [Acidobacteriota bacterium]